MKNLLCSLPALTCLPALSLPARAKVGFFLFTLTCLQACSDNDSKKDTMALLGESPNHQYRLFSSLRQHGEQSETALLLLRLEDLQEIQVATAREVAVSASNPAKESPISAPDSAGKTTTPVGKKPQGPRFYWSNDSNFLITENSMPDSSGKQEVVLFDLTTFSELIRYPGELLAFDAPNGVVFFYTSKKDRQSLRYVSLAKPQSELFRDIAAEPVGKLPVIELNARTKEARVRAYTIGGSPVNFAFHY